MIHVCLNQTNTVFISDWFTAVLFTQMKTVILNIICHTGVPRCGVNICCHLPLISL